jgi:ElaA protein
MPSPAPITLRWQTLTFDALDVRQLYAFLKLRSEIFVVEQACAYLDPDGKDTHPDALHVLGHDGDTLIAYLRILPAGVGYRHPSIGRVAIAPDRRGSGVGHALMREGLRLLLARWPGSEIRLGAQAHLRGYYAAHGFIPASPIYDEDGIPHINMLRRADAVPEDSR